MDDYVITELIRQHADEAASTWELRGTIIQGPHYTLAEVIEFDDRIEANLDGLRIAGEAGWEICNEAWGEADTGALFVLSVMGFGHDREDRARAVLEAAADSPESWPEVASALGWHTFAKVEREVRHLSHAQSPVLRLIGMAAAAIHRRDPGRPLDDALTDDDPALRARALKAAGELGRLDLLPRLSENLKSDDEKCRFYAAWSAALLSGETKAVEVLKELAVSDSTHREQALQMASRRMVLPAALSWREELARSEATLRQALLGAGIIGDPIAIPWLIEQMQVQTTARLAAESFTMLTGLDLALENLEGDPPEGFEAGPNDDPEDEDVEMDPDEFLPWPKVEGISQWWHRHQTDFQSGTRYLIGQPIKGDWLQVVLRRGYQRQRAAAALELTRRQPGQPLFEVRGPGFRQKQLLSE